jgi:hypothetical protein
MQQTMRNQDTQPHRPTWRARLCVLGALAGMLTAQAATFPVSSLADSGPGTLREAVGFANASPGADTIDLTGVTGTIFLTSGALVLSEATTFQGPGKDQLTIDAAFKSRILTGLIGNNPYTGNYVDVTVAGLSLARAYDINEFYGGAIIGNNVVATDCDFPDCHGGVGSAIYASKITLTRCGFYRCGAWHAVAATASTLAVDCRFEGNVSTRSVVGITGGLPEVELAGCTFINNPTTAVGNLGPIRLRDCVFQNNSPSLDPIGSVSAVNCAFITGDSQWASYHMLDFGYEGAKREFSNCTFINLWADQDAYSAPILTYDSTPEWTVANCIFHGSGSQFVAWSNFPWKLTVANSNWEKPLDEVILLLDAWGNPAPNNIEFTDLGGHSFSDPLFVDAANGDYRLQANSPCVDAGNNALIPVGITTDLLGNPRISGAHVDMGAYETVIPVIYDWSGILQPIKADGSSVFKAGSTVPVKFALTGDSAGISTLTARLTYVRMNNGNPGPVNQAVGPGNATPGNVFRYDATSGQYQMNWSTRGLSAGIYQLRIELGDGVVRAVNVSLR